jgi:hypothetical protein
MSMQDVEPTLTEDDKTPKRKSGRKKSRRSGTRRASAARKAQASRGTQRSRSRRRKSSGSTSGSEATAGRMLRQGRSVINRAYSFAEEARRAMPRMPRMPRVARDLRLPRRSDFDALTDANPLVIGAIGLGLGVVLGTLMPQKLSGRLSNFAHTGAATRSRSRRSRSS